METLRDWVSEAWDSLAGRIVILTAAVAWVPAVLLNMVLDAMKN